MATKKAKPTATKKPAEPCIPCKILIDCPAFAAAAESYAATVRDSNAAAGAAALGAAAFTRDFVTAYMHAVAEGLTKDYAAEAEGYSKEACDFAKRLDSVRNGVEGSVPPTVQELDEWKWKLTFLGQEIAGYEADENAG